jgi:hypothetical protein
MPALGRIFLFSSGTFCIILNMLPPSIISPFGRMPFLPGLLRTFAVSQSPKIFLQRTVSNGSIWLVFEVKRNLRLRGECPVDIRFLTIGIQACLPAGRYANFSSLSSGFVK